MELSDDFIEAFERDGFFIFKNLFTTSQLSEMHQEIEKLRSTSEFHQAGIGKAEDFKVDRSQRGDFICWIDTINPFPASQPAIRMIEELITPLNRNFYLGIRSFECHYAIYPAGTFYKKHVDRHHKSSPRIVSFVFYLNENWKEEDGGQLRIYDGETISKEVQPVEGTLVLFLSEKEHEVMPTQKSRMSLTGWMRTEAL